MGSRYSGSNRHGVGDIRNCSYRLVRLLEHGIKALERVLEKKLHRIVTVDEMQFDFLPEGGTIDKLMLCLS